MNDGENGIVICKYSTKLFINEIKRIECDKKLKSRITANSNFRETLLDLNFNCRI
jgi:hypothetical protein